MNLSSAQWVAAILVQLGIIASAGLLVGVAHYYCLWRSVQQLVAGESAVRALRLQLFQIVLVGAALWLVAVHGAAALLAATLGLLAARTLMLRVLGAVP